RAFAPSRARFDWPTRLERDMMRVIRNSALASLLLGGVIGCAGEPEAPLPSTKTANPRVSELPPASIPTKTDESKGGMSSEMTPPPAGKPAAKPEEPKKDAPKVEGPKTGSTQPAPTLSADELAEIKKLPDAEQEVAIKQAVCPVSDEHLGEMG